LPYHPLLHHVVGMKPGDSWRCKTWHLDVLPRASQIIRRWLPMAATNEAILLSAGLRSSSVKRSTVSQRGACLLLAFCWAAGVAESAGVDVGNLGADADLPDDDLVPTAVVPQPLLELQVGTEAGASNVVHDGLVMPSFSGMGAPASHSQAAFLPAQKVQKFFLSLAPGPESAALVADRVQEIRVSSSNPEVSTAFVSAKTAASRGSSTGVKVRQPSQTMGFDDVRQLLSTGSGIEFLVSSICHKAGRSQIRVEFGLEKPAFLSPAFYMDKICHAQVFAGLALGTAPGGSGAVADGVARWDERHAPSVSVNESQVHLYVTLSALDHAGVRFGPPQVRVHRLSAPQRRSLGHRPRTGAAPVLATASMQIGSNHQKLAAGEKLSAEIKVHFKCLTAAESLVEVVLTPTPLFDPYRPVSIFMRKRCRGGLRRGFDVGTTAESADLVKDGKVQARPMDVGSLDDHSEFYFQYSQMPPLKTAVAAVETHEMAKPVLSCAAESDTEDAARKEVVEAKLIADHVRQSYKILYSCQRRGVSKCLLRFNFRFWNSPELVWNKHCGGVRPDVVVESTLARHATVFASGRPVPAWASTNPEVWLQAEENVVTFMFHQTPMQGEELPRQQLELRSPKARVSDQSVLGVMVNRDAAAGASNDAVVFARNVCKRKGRAKVTISLTPFIANAAQVRRLSRPRQSGESPAKHLKVPRSNEAEQFASGDLFEPVEFSYWKACDGSAPRPFSLLRFETRWGVPEGGWRTVMWIGIGLVLLAVVYESAQRLLSNLVRNLLIKIGPDVLGTRIEVGHIMVRPWTGALYIKDVVVKNPIPYVAPYLMRAESIIVVVQMRRLIFSKGQIVDVSKLAMRTVDVNVESNGYFGGGLNVKVILDKLEKLKVHQLQYEEELRNEGLEPTMIRAHIEKIMLDLASRLAMRQVDINDINTTYISKALQVDMSLADMDWEDLTKETGAIGGKAVAVVIVKRLLENVLAEASGKEFMGSLVERFIT